MTASLSQMPIGPHPRCHRIDQKCWIIWPLTNPHPPIQQESLEIPSLSTLCSDAWGAVLSLQPLQPAVEGNKTTSDQSRHVPISSKLSWVVPPSSYLSFSRSVNQKEASFILTDGYKRSMFFCWANLGLTPSEISNKTMTKKTTTSSKFANAVPFWLTHRKYQVKLL